MKELKKERLQDNVDADIEIRIVAELEERR
jgi:hypothetical protein